MTRFLPKLRIEPWRRAAYLEAWIEARRERPKLTLADWMREALDRQADKGKLDAAQERALASPANRAVILALAK